MSRLQVKNLVKKFDQTIVAAVNGVSLDVADGSFVVLLGPSGCGKTTTLRCIAGLEKPDSGDIFLDDVRVNNLPPKDRDMAMVFQNYALYPHMTVYDNIAYPLKMRHVAHGERDTRVKEAAKLADIDTLLHRKPRQLSGGEQQRVALARVIVRQPKVFLMDEPLSNLDAKLRLSTRAELKRLQRDLKVTTIYVTHDQSEAMAIADKIAVMNKGQLLQYEAPKTVYYRPATMFVAGFLGSPATNLIKAKIVEEPNGGGVTLDCMEFKYHLPGELSQFVNGKASTDKVYLGVRPEDLKLSLNKEANSVFKCEVYVVEPLGPQNLVDLKVEGTLLKAITPSSLNVDVGQEVWASFDSARIHVFDSNGQLLV